MNKFLKVLTLSSSIILLSACSKVPAGHKGVIVNLYGSDKGVSEQTVGVGRYWLSWNQELYIFPTFLQNYTFSQDEAITMQTLEGLSIKTDVGITYNIKPENVSVVFQKYRSGIDEITHTFLHNMIRDSMNSVASTMSVEEIYGLKKQEFINKVNDLVRKESQQDGINIEKIYLIGSFELPQNVVDSINAKIQATQNAIRVENEVASTKAEAEKTIVTAQAEAQRILIDAEAKAKANKLLSESLTSEFIQYQTLLKWDGRLPQVSSGSSMPLIKFGEK